MKQDINLSDEIYRLTQKHRKLDDEADSLSAHKYLSHVERQRLKTLKVKRLWVKDKIEMIMKRIEKEDESA